MSWRRHRNWTIVFSLDDDDSEGIDDGSEYEVKRDRRRSVKEDEVYIEGGQEESGEDWRGREGRTIVCRARRCGLPEGCPEDISRSERRGRVGHDETRYNSGVRWMVVVVSQKARRVEIEGDPAGVEFPLHFHHPNQQEILHLDSRQLDIHLILLSAHLHSTPAPPADSGPAPALLLDSSRLPPLVSVAVSPWLLRTLAPSRMEITDPSRFYSQVKKGEHTSSISSTKRSSPTDKRAHILLLLPPLPSFLACSPPQIRKNLSCPGSLQRNVASSSYEGRSVDEAGSD